MKVLAVENLTKTYGEKTLFKDVNFSIATQDRIGLIGINGAGKSSLLKILAEIDQADEGVITKPKDYTIIYSHQEPQMEEDITVMDYVLKGDIPVLQVVKSYEHLLLELEMDPMNEKLQNRLFTLQKEMDANNAWDIATNAKTILNKLGIEQIHANLSTLSGGQKKRVSLAQSLIQAPDLLILDEPTNHLDFESIKWLEDYLSKMNNSLLIVSHDRYFLDKVTNRMVELDKGTLYTYKGNYQSFLEAKAIREENEASTADKLQNLYRREYEWIKRGAKARTTKQKARKDRFAELEEDLSSVTKSEKLDISLSGSRLGKQVFELKNVTKYYGEKPIFQDVNLLINRHDRIGIIGKNGAGKSTLLNILAKKVPIDQGQLIVGQTVKIAYYTQQNVEMDESLRMLDYVKETASVIETTDGKVISVAQMLERFLFPSYTHGTPIMKLSGGEKRRLYLLKILMMAPNVLLLDEPTNNLDTQTLTILEDYLETFPGVVITVSHDRYFLDKVADELFILNGNQKIERYLGSYSEYAEKIALIKTQEKPKQEKTESIQKEEQPKKKKMTYNEQREWETIGERIETAEQRIEEIDQLLLNVGSDYTKAQNLMDEQTELIQHLEHLYERWEYLSEF